MNHHVFWVPRGAVGLEHLALGVDGAGITADSLVIGVDDAGVPFRLRYTIQCDNAWRVQTVEAQLLGADARRTRVVRADAGWLVDDQLRPDLNACVDVDITATPFTNTLPIRRLRFQPGQIETLHMAYLHVPEMVWSCSPQRYTCLEHSSGGSYRYEGLDSGFTAVLAVDALGLVTDYPGLFMRVYSLPHSAQ